MDIKIETGADYRRMMRDVSRAVGTTLEQELRAHDKKILSIRDTKKIEGFALTEERTRFFDTALFKGIELLDPPSNIVIVAPGSYGRDELTPNSDLDLNLFDFGNSDDSGLKDFITRVESLTYEIVLNFSDIPGEKKPFFSSGRPDIISFDDHEKVKRGDLRAINDRVVHGSALLDMRVLYSNVDELDDKVAEIFSHVYTPELSLHHKSVVQGYNELRRNNSDSSAGLYGLTFNIKKDIGGLRHFMHTRLLLAAQQHISGKKSYDLIPFDVLKAYDFHLHVRSVLNLVADSTLRKTNCDIINQDIIPKMEEYFGKDFRHMLFDARQTISRFSRMKYEEIMDRGISIDEHFIATRDGIAPSQTNGFSVNTNLHRAGILAIRHTDSFTPSFMNTLLANTSRLTPKHDFIHALYTPGKFANYIITLDELGVLQNFFPGYDQCYTTPHIYQRRKTTNMKAGRIIERLKNLDEQVQFSKNGGANGVNAELYAALPEDLKAALRLQLIIKDLPTIMGISQEDYLQKLKTIYGDTIVPLFDGVRYLSQKGSLLFDCAQYDNTTDKKFLEEKVLEIGVTGEKGTQNLDLLRTYVYAVNDYGKQGHFDIVEWDRTSTLHRNLITTITGERPFSGIRDLLRADNDEDTRRPTLSLMDRLPESIFYSGYLNTLDQFMKTLEYIHTVDTNIVANKEYQLLNEKNQLHGVEIPEQIQRSEYAIKVIPGSKENPYAIIMVTAPESHTLVEKIAGACYLSGLPILDGEKHLITSSNGYDPVAVVFMTCRYDPNENTSEEVSNTINEIITGEREVGVKIEDIIKNMKPEGTVESLGENRYRIIITGKDTPGGLYALTHVLASEPSTVLEGMKILTDSRNTHTEKYAVHSSIIDTFTFRTANPAYLANAFSSNKSV